jgi:hypothetical protein
MQSTEHGPGLWAITGGRLPAGLACHAQELVSWELQCCGVRIDSASTPSPYIINATTVATQPMNPLCRVARAGIPDNEAGVCPGLLIPTIARIGLANSARRVFQRRPARRSSYIPDAKFGFVHLEPGTEDSAGQSRHDRPGKRHPENGRSDGPRGGRPRRRGQFRRFGKDRTLNEIEQGWNALGRHPKRSPPWRHAWPLAPYALRMPPTRSGPGTKERPHARTKSTAPIRKER